MRESPWIKALRKLLRVVSDATSRRARGKRWAAFTPRFEQFEPRLTPAAPTVLSINRVGSAPFTNAASLDFVVTFSQPVTGVDAADFQIAKTGTIATTSLQVTGSATAYTVTVGGISGGGTVGLNLIDNNSIRNSANNPLYASNGASVFQAVNSYSTGLQSGSIAAADFNADGKLDVALVDYYASSAPTGILFGNGDGTFQAPRTFSGIYQAAAVLAQDMNGDGKPDLVVVNNAFQSGGAGAVMLGNGDGTFKPAKIFQADNQSGPLAVADLNGDGKPDVVTASYTGRMSVLLGNGDGGFKPRTTYAAGRATSVQIGDVNNDHKPDIVVGNQRDNYFGIYLGNGDGTYQSPTPLSMGFITDFELADVDGDGNLDLIATNDGAAVSRFLGNGDGTFRTPTTYQAVGNTVCIDLADLNGDGRLDVVIGQRNAGSAGMLLGMPGGNFGPFVPLNAGFAATNVAIADVTNDSRPDILAVGRYNDRYFGSFVNAVNGNFTGSVATIDQAAPVLTLTSKPPAIALKQSATFAFTAVDPQVGGIASGVNHVEYQFDGGPITNGVSPLVFNNLAPGNHTFTARAIDNAGNASATFTDSWVVDLVSPPHVESITRTSPAGAFVNTTSVTYSVYFNGVVTGVDVSDFSVLATGTLTTGAVQLAGSGDTYTVTVNGIAGDGTIQLRVNDDDTIVSTLNSLPLGGAGAGNGLFNGAVETVDRTLPTAAITSQPPSDTTDRTATFSFTGGDPTAGGVSSGLNHLEYSLDGGTYVTATGPITTPRLQIGVHTFQVRAVDNAGNIGAAASYTWNVNLPAAPSVVSIAPAAPASSASSIDFIVRFSQAVTGVDAADFSVVKSANVVDGAITVTGSGTTYTVTVSGVVGDGTLGLKLVDNNSIHNLYGMPLYAANSNATFQPAISYTTNLASGTIPAADFNGDGKLDIILVDKFGNFPNVGILFGNGDGTFQSPIRFNGISGNVDVLIRDMNGDGKPDLVLENSAFQYGASGGVMLGNGNGTFKPPQTFAIDNQSGVFDVADINGDGKPDVISASYTGRMSVSLGNGDGTFQPRMTYTTGRSTGVRIGDLNNDGKPDVMIANQRDNFLGAYLGNGDGTFQAPQTVSVGFVAGEALADVDGDGNLDLLATDYDSHVYRLFGNGDGTFRAAAVYPTIGNAVAIETADMNGDGLLDVVIGQTRGGSVGYLLGTGGGNFGDFFPLNANYGVNNISIADVNNDSRPDILSESWYNSRYFSVLVNAARGDFTGQTVNVDQSKPVATITSGPPANSLKQTAIFAFSATDPTVSGVSSGIDHYEYQLDGGAFIRAASPVSLAGLAGGSHTFGVRAVDGAGNIGDAASDTWNVDLTSAPSIDSIIRTSPVAPIVNANSLVFTVAFNALVSGVDPTDFSVVATGTATSGAILVSGSGDTYTVTVNGVAGDGTLALRIDDDDTIVSTINGLPIGGPGLGNGALTGPAYTVDHTGPTATITAQPPATTSDKSAIFSFTGADPTTGGVAAGVDHFEYKLDGGAFATAVSPLTLTGLSVASHTFQVRAVDAVGNIGPAASYTWTVVLPPFVQSINRSTPSSQLTNAASVTYTVAFTEPVTGVDAADFKVVADSTVSFNPALVVAGSGAQYTVTISGIRGTGSLQLNLIDDQSIASNFPLGGTGLFNGSFQGQKYLVSPALNSISPFVVSISRGSPADQFTVAASLSFNLTFSEAVTGVDATDFQVVLTGSATGTIGSVTAVDASHYTVSVTGASGLGQIGLSLIDNGTIRDSNGNPLRSNAGQLFNNETVLQVGRDEIALATADFNGDGLADLVTSDNGGANAALHVLLNNGDGTFRISTVTTPQPTYAMDVGDLNGDGIVDIVSAPPNDSGIPILLGKGDGTFRPATTTAALKANAIAVADMNGDGKPDLVTTVAAGGGVGIVLGTGDGTFGPQSTFAAPSSNGLAIADVNGDSFLDVIVGAASGSMSILLGNGDGSLRPQTVAFASTTALSILAVDLNNDGKLDLVNSGWQNNAVRVSLGNGNGTFQTQSSLATQQFPFASAVGDFNQDGILDIVAANSNTGSASVFLGNGNGTFQLQIIFGMQPGARSVKVADLNGDGRPDFATVNPYGTTASIRFASNGSFTGDTYFEKPLSPLAAPYVISMNRETPPASSTNAASVAYRVSFSEPVTGVDPSDFSVTVSGALTTTSPIVVSGSGSSYLVTVNGIAGNGAININLVDDGSIRDLDSRRLVSNTVAFANQVTYATPNATPSITTADINLDGKLDLVTANSTSNSFSVLLGNGDGTFKPEQTFGTNNMPTRAVLVADINGDGKPDVILSRYNGTGISVFLGNGDVTFRPRLDFYAAGPLTFDAGDINGDGKLDLAVPANVGSSTVGLYLGNGTGVFSPIPAIPVPTAACWAKLVDINGDGKLDVVSSSITYATVNVSLGNGNGTFRPRMTFAALPGAIAGDVGDIDGDGKPDIAVPAQNGGLSVLLGNGDGSFKPQMTFAAGPNPRSATIADLNGDGRADLVVSNRTSNAVNILLGNGDGSFSAPLPLSLGTSTTVFSGTEPRQFVVADFNGDGRLDIVTANGLANNSLSVLLALNGSAAGQTTSIDQTLPAVSIGSKPSATTNSTAATFTFTGSDPTVGGVTSGVNHFEYQLDAAAFATSASPVNLSALAEGNHTFAVRAVDNAGNAGTATNYSWVIDLTAPTASLGSPPAVTNGTATFSLSGVDPVAAGISSGVNHLEYQLDGGAFITTASTLNLTNLAGGNHTLGVRAVDNAGNVGSPASFTWLVDFGPPTAPSVARLNPTYSLTTGPSVTYEVTFNEAVTGVDASDFVVALSGVTVTPPVVVTAVSSSVYDVTVGGIAGSGTLGLNLVDDDTIRDVLDLPLATSGDVVGPTYSINNIAPLATLSANSIAENNAVGATIGTLSANDPNAGGTFAFSLPAGLTDNAAFNISGASLQAAAAFDYEAKSSYTVTVRVTHVSGLSYDKAFTVNIQNVVETTAVYVSDAWAALANGSVIADADPFQAGNQPATIGVTAFASLPPAVAALDAGGTGNILLLAGNYPSNVTLDRPISITVSNLTAAAVIGGAISGPYGLVKQGVGGLILTGANTYAGGTVLGAGLLQIGNGGTTGSIAGDVIDNGTLTFNRSDAITFTGVISGTGNLFKTGNGTLALGGANTFAGGVTVSRGTLLVGANNQLGDAAAMVTVNSPGKLTVTADATSSRQFFLNNATLQVNSGVTLTLSNAEINGGFLSGPGSITTSSGPAFSTTFAGTTSQTSLAINANGADAFVSFTNNGSLTLSNQATTTLSGFNNSSFGRLTANGAADVSEFSTIGQFTVNGLVDNVGASDLGFGGVTTINAGGEIDLEATDALVANGLVKNGGAFGSSTNTIVVDFGGYVKGTGTFGNVITQNGGYYAPGNSPGAAKTNQYNLNGGGILEFEVSNAAGAAGDPSGWDMIVVQPTVFNEASGVAKLTATPSSRYTILLVSRLDSGDHTAAGAAANFNAAQGYAWKFADVSNPAAGISGVFNPAAFTIDTSGFANSYTGMFGVELRDGGKNLYVVYTPPAVATIVALAATPNATTGGELATFTATVAPNPGTLGTVNFLDNGALLAGGSGVALTGGVATFQTSILAAGTHAISAAYSGATGYAANTSNTLSFGVTASAPQLLSVTPNGNIASLAGDQRARVANLVVVFNQPVQLDANALALALHANNVTFGGVSQPTGYGTLPASLNLGTTDNVTWTVTFTGNTDNGLDGLNSLKDGVYDLNIDAAKVHPLGVSGLSMAANSTTTFHRLFGDTNAPATPSGGTPGVDFQAVVNTGDNLAFRGAFNNAATYKAFLDFNGDGVINSGDNLQFRNRFNKALTWKV